MKFFLVVLLAATCQAWSIESMIEKKAFDYFVSEATAELEKLALEEFENAILSDNKEINAVERSLINKFATYFGSALRAEVDEIVHHVVDASVAKTAFAKKMYENLRQAALNMTEGMHMAPKAAQKFLNDMMADIEAMEKSGTFVLDIEDMFKNIVGRVEDLITYEMVNNYDLSDIWGKINDTLLNIIGHLHGRYHDLHDFLKKIVASAGEKLQPHIVNIKTLAKDFIAHINDVSINVATQALEFFKPFASKLGNTWVQLVQKVHERLQAITDAN